RKNLPRTVPAPSPKPRRQAHHPPVGGAVWVALPRKVFWKPSWELRRIPSISAWVRQTLCLKFVPRRDSIVHIRRLPSFRVSTALMRSCAFIRSTCSLSLSLLAEPCLRNSAAILSRSASTAKRSFPLMPPYSPFGPISLRTSAACLAKACGVSVTTFHCGPTAWARIGSANAAQATIHDNPPDFPLIDLPFALDEGAPIAPTGLGASHTPKHLFTTENA